MGKFKLVIYAVPDLNRVNGGPRTRIQLIAHAAIEERGAIFIKGTWWQKIKNAIKVKGPIDLLYVESSTNRMAWADFVSLVMLRIKSKKLVVYIRDTYIEFFPDEYKKGRKVITKWLNKISNFSYTILADKLAFPTLEMGDFFMKQNNFYARRPYFALPPGSTILDEINIPHSQMLKLRLRRPSLAYIGSIRYINSGINHFLNFAARYREKYNFYILTPDLEIRDIINNSYPELRNRIIIKSLKYKEMVRYIVDEHITFAFHTRPQNSYDDLTYPIKVMDYVSLLLPIISIPHKPVVSLLGEKYPLFFNFLDNYNAIEKAIDKYSDNDSYLNLINHMIRVRDENTYSVRITELIKNV